jgi:catalase
VTESGQGLAQELAAADEGAVTVAFIEFLKSASLKRHPTGAMPRFNQGRTAACVDAEFAVADGLPAELRVGLFARPARFRAKIRFAHASSQSDKDKDVRGMSIKLLDVGGENLTAGESSHDFVLNSHPVMMVGDTRAFLDLLQAVEAGRARAAFFFLTHPRAAAIAMASRQHATSHLEIPYWSTTPYLFGPGRAVKYVVRPEQKRITPLPNPLTDSYLRDRLVDHLARSDARFEFCVQFQTDSRKMPIEDASTEWREQDSPYIVVGHIRIPSQALEPEVGAAACEQLSFNPWNALAPHRPLGGFNRARREIYRAMAAFRRERA